MCPKAGNEMACSAVAVCPAGSGNASTSSAKHPELRYMCPFMTESLVHERCVLPGLAEGADSVRQVVSEAKYMVLGLGDVYLGAPCAVPVDPRSAGTLHHQ